MPLVSKWFFVVAVVYGLIGMCWGEFMAVTKDHSLYPAHSHLNLLGLVLMAIYGTFYTLIKDSYLPKLAWLQFALSNIGLWIMIPLLAVLLKTGDESLGPLIGIGGVSTILGLLLFGYAVLRNLKHG